MLQAALEYRLQQRLVGSHINIGAAAAAEGVGVAQLVLGLTGAVKVPLVETEPHLPVAQSTQAAGAADLVGKGARFQWRLSAVVLALSLLDMQFRRLPCILQK